MPNLNFMSNIDYLIKPKTIGGQAILSISADGYKRKSASDGVLGRDATSANLTLSWQKDSLTKFGGIFGIKSFTTAGLSKYYNDSINPNLINQIHQIAGVEFSLPMLNKYAKTSLIYNPKIQVVYSPPYNTSEPNEISQHSEVSSSNFFNLNHSYGSDRVVNGMHLKTGLETSYYGSKKDQINLFIGNFTKLNGINSFGIGSGLESETSSNIGAINVMLANKFSFDADFVTNSTLQVTRNNMRISYTEKYMDFYSHFFYKPENENSDERSELNFGSEFNLTKRTNATLSLAYDAKENKIMQSKLLSRYKHDCMTVDFYVSRDFNSGGSGSPGVKLGLQLELMGLGAGKSSRALNEKNCSG
jgi:lipopolysaccharide assembly outer membrane protein LptD (OstA)